MDVRSEIPKFQRAPQEFAGTLSGNDAPIRRQGLKELAQLQIAEKGVYPLRASQVTAWNGLANQRVGLNQGPPRTGKTYVLAWMALDDLQARRAAGLPCRILANAFTLNAIGNLHWKVLRVLPRGTHCAAPPQLEQRHSGLEDAGVEAFLRWVRAKFLTAAYRTLTFAT
jgi:hypothetical protein